MAQAGYEIIEHTADLALRAFAPDLPGLIEQAARGMIDLMFAEVPAPEHEVEVVGEGACAEDLLVDCLREVVLLIDLDGLAPVTVEVLEAGEGRARCRVGVVSLAAARGELEQAIKAVTYHGIDVRETGEGLEVEVVFDV